MLDKVLHAPIYQAMRQNPLFQMLGDEHIEQMLTFSYCKEYSQDQIIFQQGEPLNCFYYVCDGAVKLTRNTRNGDEKIIEVVCPGRTFAEAAIFMGVPQYPVSVSAIKRSTLVAINGKEVIKILKNDSDLTLKMLAHLSRRLHWMLSELDKLTLHNASFRIIDYFLSHVKNISSNDYDLELDVPKRDIASRLSIKPETLSRVLKSLQERGLITIQDNHIHLHNIFMLKRMVELEEI